MHKIYQFVFLRAERLVMYLHRARIATDETLDDTEPQVYLSELNATEFAAEWESNPEVRGGVRVEKTVRLQLTVNQKSILGAFLTIDTTHGDEVLEAVVRQTRGIWD